MATSGRRGSSIIGLSVAFALLLAACGGALGQAKSNFKKGRYEEARQELVALEVESRGWDDGRRAEYALYRGLCHAAVGDRAPASLWLNESRAEEAAHPGALSADDAARLKVALEALEAEQRVTNVK